MGRPFAARRSSLGKAAIQVHHENLNTGLKELAEH